MQDRLKKQLDALLDEREGRQRQRQEESGLAAEERLQREGHIAAKFSATVLPVLDAMTEYLGGRRMSASATQEQRGTSVKFQVPPGSFVHIFGRTEDMTLDLYPAIRGQSGTKVAISLEELTSEWFEARMLDFVQGMLMDP